VGKHSYTRAGMEPETRYARLGDDRIAYQVVGDGPVDLVMSWGMFSTLDAVWQMSETAAPYLRLAEVCRLILFDRLGTGWSDAVPLDALPPLESRWNEIQAVMDDAGSKRAVLMGMRDGGLPVMFGAATAPDRASGLILMHAAARHRWDVDYPFGMDDSWVAESRKLMADWDIDQMFATSFPSRADQERYLQWGRRSMRRMATPTAMAAYIEEMMDVDVRDLLPAIQVPTLVLHRQGYRWGAPDFGRYIADNIADARFVELPGTDDDLFFDETAAVLAAINRFLAQVEPRTAERRSTERLMATIMFTDIVDSTMRAGASGDSSWVGQLQTHDDMSQDVIARHGGRLVKTTGDGVLAVFDGPGRGLMAADTLSLSLERVGLPVRAGLHTGEVELRGEDVAGVGVHIAARVMSVASPAEVMVSRTVRDLVVGSDFRFEDRGSHHLKGIEGEWQLYALTRR
jgi:class 3 adenylate cyclase